MKQGVLINEVFWLRCLACLAVTFGHAIKSANVHYIEPTIMHIGSYVLYMIVLFGVPVFIFISEFLLAYKYPKRLPAGFITKRLSLLLIPYLVMSSVYAIMSVETWTFTNVIITMCKTIFLGESSVYFILIIFQFYFLHLLCHKYLARMSPKVMLLGAFLINLLYLGFFNFTEPPANAFGSYFWNPGYWMPFLGWLFYFVLGFYCGRNYSFVLEKLHKYKKLVIIFPILSLLLMLLANKYFLIDQSSKRIDMLVFAVSMIFLIMYRTSIRGKVPPIVMMISNYSFSIFLLNQVFFILLSHVKPPVFLNILSYSLVAFLLSLFASILTSYLLNRFKFGKYIVGKIMPFKLENTHNVAYQSRLMDIQKEQFVK